MIIRGGRRTIFFIFRFFKASLDNRKTITELDFGFRIGLNLFGQLAIPKDLDFHIFRKITGYPESIKSGLRP